MWAALLLLALLVLAVCAINLAQRWPLARATEIHASHPSCHGTH